MFILVFLKLVLIKQVKDIRARYWYMVQSIANHWTTRYLQEAIKLDDYELGQVLPLQGCMQNHA